MKWLLMLYVFIAMSFEYVYHLFRCMIDRPIVYKDWPQLGMCLSCNERHEQRST